ncbi:MAG: hypothetical protein LR015_04935 [Verrucomicrobia bacterium]|nr:hypothetical protein [Verrucomicrobiota bacterium]
MVFRVAPGLLTLAAIFGAAVGGVLFPAFREFGVLDKGVVWIPNLIHFEIAPLLAALWYALFSGPRHLLTAISLRNGDGAVLTASGVHSHYFLDIPGFWGALITIFTLTILISLAIFAGAFGLLVSGHGDSGNASARGVVFIPESGLDTRPAL